MGFIHLSAFFACTCSSTLVLQACGGGEVATTTTTPLPTPSTTITSTATTTTTTTITPTTTVTHKPTGNECLCVFDIDRTLTGKQGDTSSCPANLLQPGISDSAYGGGTLTLSALSQHLDQTFCKNCYVGTISAGTAGGEGSPERADLQNHLAVFPGKLPTTTWSAPGCASVTSPLVTGCQDGHKQLAVPLILDWYRHTMGMHIADSSVYFFDDRSDNVQAFKGLSYNAHQIACAQRDLGGSVGLCGAALDEIMPREGVTICGDKSISI